MEEDYTMKRFSFTLPPDLVNKIDDASKVVLMNRSQIVREALTHWLHHSITDNELQGNGISVIHYEYDHEDMRVVEDIMKIQHSFEDIITSSTHIHISNSRCFELIICRGDLIEIKNLTGSIRSIKGITSFFANYSKT